MAPCADCELSTRMSDRWAILLWFYLSSSSYSILNISWKKLVIAWNNEFWDEWTDEYEISLIFFFWRYSLEFFLIHYFSRLLGTNVWKSFNCPAINDLRYVKQIWWLIEIYDLINELDIYGKQHLWSSHALEMPM